MGPFGSNIKVESTLIVQIINRFITETGGFAMFCPECGSEISNDAKFCSNCGKQIIDAKASTFDNSPDQSNEPSEKQW